MKTDSQDVQREGPTTWKDKRQNTQEKCKTHNDDVSEKEFLFYFW